jgi:ATP-dependent DNA helicase RecG
VIEKKDKERFKKVYCENILDLILNIPINYENRYINDTFFINQTQVIKAKILSIKQNYKTLQIQLFAINTNKNISCTIFNYKPFHLGIFKTGSIMYLLGKVFINNINTLEISQPKVINENDINKIYAKYSSIVVKNLCAKYITKEYLSKYNFDKTTIENIIEIHYPTKDFIDKYNITNNIYSDKLSSHLNALKLIEVYNFLSKMNTKKKDFLSIKVLDFDISRWIEDLPFSLTDDQLSAINDIKKDFLSSKSTRRMIVGDVGCGKTMIILASALIAYPNKSILMAPTTILAKQLYQEAKKFLGVYMDIELITNKTKDINKNAHFIIGTHAILYKQFSDISLIMIDEQHKFGSKQRQLIESFSKQDDKRAHFLQFSATPIPRTMAMLQSSLIDFSFIKQIPFKKDISTQIILKKDFPTLLEHIKEQIKDKKQTIIVYPLVNESQKIDYLSIEEAKDFWLKKFDNVYITSGQDKDKEEILEKFCDRGDILLATTLIEVGISLPRLSTIVIVGADRLGLASLHQLRGRVGRYGFRGYCFLYSNTPSDRLKKFCNIQSGFDIAQLDLEYRQSGDILGGIRQSGKMFEYINMSEDEDIIQKALILK